MSALWKVWISRARPDLPERGSGLSRPRALEIQTFPEFPERGDKKPPTARDEDPEFPDRVLWKSRLVQSADTKCPDRVIVSRLWIRGFPDFPEIPDRIQTYVMLRQPGIEHSPSSSDRPPLLIVPTINSLLSPRRP